MATPSDVQWQLDHIHATKSSDILISHIVVLPLAIVAVILRFISRRMCKGPIKADDYVIILALVLAILETAGGLLCVAAGGGKHVITVKDPARLNKFILATEIVYTPAITTVKLSVLLLYRRVFPSVKFRKILWGIGCFIVCYALAQELTIIFQCSPINGAWDPAVHAKAKCVKINLLFVIMASFNVLTDMVTLCLPLPLLWRLQIDMERKIQLIGVFLLGSFVCIVSIYRVPKVWDLALSDPGWTDTDACVWSEVEVCVGIICACLPTFRALFNRSLHKWRGSAQSDRIDLAHRPPATPDVDRVAFEVLDDEGLCPSKVPHSSIAKVDVEDGSCFS